MFTFRRIVYLFVVMCAAYAAHYFIDSPETAWAIPVTFTLSLVTAGRTLLMREWVLCLMGLSLVITSVLSNYFIGHHTVLIAYLVFLMLLYMRYLHAHLGSGKMFVLFVFLTLVFASNIGSHETYTERTAIILLGVVMAMVLQFIFWRILIIDNTERALKTAVTALRNTNHGIFDCLLSVDYPDNIYAYESQLHLHKRQFYAGLTTLRQMIVRLGAASNQYISAKKILALEAVYENMMDYAQLRWRVEDHTSYALCAPELRYIAMAIHAVLAHISNKSSFSLDQLEAAIDGMESVYQSVLKTAVQDPVAILLFIASLRGFLEKLSAAGAA